MKKVTVLIVLLLCLVFHSNAQIDTVKINSEIVLLTNDSLVQDYWNRIYKTDQKFRGAEYNDTIDHLNLYKVITMLEKFDYPQKKKFGFQASSAPWIVWSHNPCNALKEKTFGIIVLADSIKEIPQGLFPDYFVGGLLRAKYGFDPIEEKISNDYLSALKPIETQVETEDIYKIILEHLRFRNQSIINLIGRWVDKKGEDKPTVNIHLKENGKLYFDKEFVDGSYGVQEVVFTNTSKKSTEYTFVENINSYSLLINSKGDLKLLDSKGKKSKKVQKDTYCSCQIKSVDILV